ncbi:hypothetical protein [Micromonospora sp. MA102]|uniref:hypothetical protein n=1 Tax=Micromonospora sp. MA102 TaxID=2952755 RepID=UPI0021C58FF9|nr:hypothetical protein [Micromonospora sp. MA102]
MDYHELRRQVLRRLRYGLNVVALEKDLVPPEGPFDVALTNGLAAIVACDHPGLERGPDGRMLPASGLLKVLEGAGTSLDYEALREALKITQPMRHGRADDEFLLPVRRHLEALVAIDGHPALRVLEHARAAAKVDDLLAILYAEAASHAAGLGLMSPDDQLHQPDLEECDECWRMTFLPAGFDEFGGTNSQGRCFACGYERDAETAWRYARDAEWDRVMGKD